MIGELVSCYLRNKEIMEKVEWTQKGRIAQPGCPDVRRMTCVSQQRVRYNFERGSKSVYAPLNLGSNV